MIRPPVRSIKAPLLGVKAGRNVNNAAKHLGVFALEAKDFVVSFTISAFGIKKPSAKPAKRATKKRRTRR